MKTMGYTNRPTEYFIEWEPNNVPEGCFECRNVDSPETGDMLAKQLREDGIDGIISLFRRVDIDDMYVSEFGVPHWTYEEERIALYDSLGIRGLIPA